MQSQKLTRPVSEGDRAAVRRLEAECLDVVGDLFDCRQHELSQPADFAGGRIVFLIMPSLVLQLRRQREDLDLFVPWAAGGKALAKGQKQPRIPLESNLSAKQCDDEVLLAR